MSHAESAFGDGQTVTVYFTNAGSSGLYIKNKNYVHFEIGTANGNWACLPASHRLLLIRLAGGGSDCVVDVELGDGGVCWCGGGGSLQLVHGAVRAGGGAAAVRGVCRNRAAACCAVRAQHHDVGGVADRL